MIRNGVEECDDGGESVFCNTNCMIASCGDGIVNVTSGEACDDGNLNNDDGCDAQCQSEASLFCYTSNRIRVTSGFIDHWSGSNPQNSNGMIVSLQPDDMGNYTGCQGDGNGFYSNGGGHTPHTITRADGQNFSALEFVAGDGWGQCTNYGYAVAYLDGQVVGECILNGQANQTIYGF